MKLVLKKKKSAGSSGDYPRTRTAKRTAAFKMHRKLTAMLDDEESEFGFEGSERAKAKAMLNPVLARFAKVCGIDGSAE